MTIDPARIDPAQLRIALSVLAQVDELDVDHPDAIAVRRATARIFKSVKQRRRSEKRQFIAQSDRAVVAATATGAPGRIDDETAGIRLVSTTPGAVAGHLQRAMACYVCKQRFTQVDAFYHQLCPDCAQANRARRDPDMDLTGRRALLTGGRAKIGMYIALMLLRAGADVTITTRFPRDAARRFASMPDHSDWVHRVHVIGVDLRDPAQVVALADEVAAAGPLDILINNAAQTVRRSPGSYSGLVDGESAPLTGSAAGISMITMGRTSELHPAALMGGESALIGSEEAEREAHHIASLALQAGSSSLERMAAGTAIDAGGLLPDVVDHNSWVATVEQVEPMEMLEVQLCNSVAPFILVSRLRPALAASRARRKYVVNVSAMEGQFSRRYKGAGHPHTNMAKAGLNMLTRTSAEEMFTEHGILMTAVDTGWITDERPHTTKVRLHEEGFHAPLDLVDGAARVYDPIVRGEAGEDVHGVFLKDYEPSPW